MANDEFTDACERHRLNMTYVHLVGAGAEFSGPIAAGTCPCCESYMPDVGRRRLNTAYVDDSQNYLTSCGECYQDAVEHYKELWDDYYSGLM